MSLLVMRLLRLPHLNQALAHPHLLLPVRFISLLIIILSAAHAVFLAALALPPAQAGATLSVQSRTVYRGHGFWSWDVSLQAPEEVLSRIRCVEYRLGSDVAVAQKEVCSMGRPERPFGAEGTTNAPLPIRLRIIFTSGDVEELDHVIALKATPVAQPLPITPTSIVTKQGGTFFDIWRWTVFLQADPNVLDEILCVRYNLTNPLSVFEGTEGRVKEVCDRGTGARPFAVDGSSDDGEQMDVQIYLRNGQVQEMQYRLPLPRA